MENSEAGKLLNSIHGPSCRAVYHPERLRKNRYSLTIAASGSGGVNDMQEIGCGKDWEDAFADMWKQSITELEAKLAAKWISVDERLPEATQGQVEGPLIISDDVVCYWPADGGIHEVCNYDHEEGLWTLVHKGFSHPDCDPTHWQPLPPDPPVQP